jgi:hypothetical protein
MRAYGYKRDDEHSEEPIDLREITLLCNAEDLRRLHAFLEKVLVERAVADAEWHEHLRDRDKSWTKEESDVILYFRP